MTEWGRKEYSKKWPSRTPVWTWTATHFHLTVWLGTERMQVSASGPIDETSVSLPFA